MIARLAVPAAFALRDFRIQRSYRVGFVLGIGAAVANVIVFFFLSEALGVVSGSGIRAYGSDYFGFAIVGIAFTQIVAVGVGSMGGAVREGQVTGTLELMLIGPTPPIVALLSSGLFAHLMAFASIAVYLVVGSVVGLDLSRADLPATILALALLIVGCNALGLVGAAVVLLIKQGNPVNWIVTGASFVLGGVSVPNGGPARGPPRCRIGLAADTRARGPAPGPARRGRHRRPAPSDRRARRPHRDLRAHRGPGPPSCRAPGARRWQPLGVLTTCVRSMTSPSRSRSSASQRAFALMARRCVGWMS